MTTTYCGCNTSAEVAVLQVFLLDDSFVSL